MRAFSTTDNRCGSNYCYYDCYQNSDGYIVYKCIFCGKFHNPQKKRKEMSFQDIAKEIHKAKLEGREPRLKKLNLNF